MPTTKSGQNTKLSSITNSKLNLASRQNIEFDYNEDEEVKK